MKAVVIHDRNGFRLTSYGNGWAHLIEWVDEEGMREKSVWLQDEDSTIFRAEYDAAQAIEDEGRSEQVTQDVFGNYECVAQTDDDAR